VGKGTNIDVKNMVVWVVTSCSSERAQCFGGTYCLHLQERKVNQLRNQQKQLRMLPASAGFLLGLLFSYEDGGNMLLQTVGLFLNYTLLNPDDHILYSHHLENMKSKIWICFLF
jgi:hypothetical protein